MIVKNFLPWICLSSLSISGSLASVLCLSCVWWSVCDSQTPECARRSIQVSLMRICSHVGECPWVTSHEPRDTVGPVVSGRCLLY